MLIRKEDNTDMVLDTFPQILALNAGGEPLHWISYKDSAYYMSLGKVLWSAGQYEVRLRGGTNAMSGERSIMMLDTIIALDNDLSPTKYRREVPALSNRELFSRDRHLCAYCSTTFSEKSLTRDHVLPRSKGGKDSWNNVVTCCKPCNQRKDDMTLKKARMQLVYVPYTPSYNETLILKNRRILADQMEFLLKGVSKKSRLHNYVKDGQYVTAN